MKLTEEEKKIMKSDAQKFLAIMAAIGAMVAAAFTFAAINL